MKALAPGELKGLADDLPPRLGDSLVRVLKVDDVDHHKRADRTILANVVSDTCRLGCGPKAATNPAIVKAGVIGAPVFEGPAEYLVIEVLRG